MSAGSELCLEINVVSEGLIDLLVIGVDNHRRDGVAIAAGGSDEMKGEDKSEGRAPAMAPKEMKKDEKKAAPAKK